MTAVRTAATALGSVFRSRGHADPDAEIAALEEARGYAVANDNGPIGVAQGVRMNRAGQPST
ncbi:MAG: hypothetical protein ACR2OD_10560, partial [Gaiellaceae bacterium]